MAERSDSYESDILEGFLCPICKSDLKDLNRLKTHFQEQHPEDQDVLKSLKEIFGKATKKILKLDDDRVSEYSRSLEYEIDTEEQEIGYMRTHTKYLKAIRCNHLEHFTTETNKLIIRLDQLLLVDSSDRKQHEQNIVHWLDGTSVKLCPQCAKSFNVTRRQHHCRLCGCVMCHSCSLFLSRNIGKGIITGAIHETEPPKSVSETDSLRVCAHCMEMLDYRRRIQLHRTTQPIICELYYQLQQLRQKINPDVELYKKMCASLHAGEPTYNLTDSQALRGHIGKQGEVLDAISKRIVTIPLNPEIPRAVTLQNAIRQATSNYIKDTLLSLPPLPTPAELMEKRNRFQNNEWLPTPAYVPKTVIAKGGWSTEVVTNVSETEEDPLIQQMTIVREYIKQARQAMRFEEVASLEAHLHELDEAVRKNKQANERT